MASAADTLVIAASPILFLKFDEASGSLLDASGNGYNFSAPAAFTRQQAAAVIGGSFSVNCGSDFATSADAAALRLMGTDFTIGFWINCTGNANGRTFLYKDSQWQVITNGSGKVAFNFPSRGLISGDTSMSLPVGSWAFVTVTRSGTTYGVYVNAVLGTSNTIATAQVADPSTAFIGSTGNDLMDDLFFLPTAWSLAQIQAYYTAATVAGVKFRRTMNARTGSRSPAFA